MAGQGFRVFPCRPEDKRPLNSNGCSGATDQTLTIESWWTSWPDAMIGLATDGLVVVDVDPDGVEWFATAEVARFCERGLIQTTPRGGRHYIFSARGYGPVSCGSNILHRGIDIRARGGYIIAAPSVSERGRYSLEYEEWPEIDRLPDLPEALYTAIKSAQRQKVVDSVQGSDKIREPGRNDQLYQLGLKLSRAGIAAGAMEKHLQIENETRCEPVMDFREVQRIATNVNKSQAANEPEVKLDTLLKSLHIKCAKYNGLQWTTFADIEERPIDWLWKGRLAAGKMHLMAGEAGIGKSFWLCWLAAKITRGGKLPDGQVMAPGRVAMLIGEDDPGDTIKPRLMANGADENKIHLLQSHQREGRPHPICLKNAASELEDHCKEFPDLKVLIVDPITEFLSAEINDNGAVRQALGPLTAVCRTTGLAVLSLTHLRKSNGKDKESGIMTRILGAGAFSAQARIVHGFVTSKDNGTTKIVQAKNNLAQKPVDLEYKIRPDGKIVFEEPIDLDGVLSQGSSSAPSVWDQPPGPSVGKVTEF